MATQITINGACDLYLSELQREMAGMSQSDRLIKRYSVFVERTKRTVFLSIVDLIREVQNRTEIGKARAVEYVNELVDSKGESIYTITG